MKKLIYLCIFLSIFLINCINTKAYLVTCSYENVDLKNNDSTGTRMYLELDGTRRLLWLDNPTAVKNAAQKLYDNQHFLSLYDPRDRVEDATSSLFKFSSSFNKLYLSISDYSSHDLNAYAFWLNFNDISEEKDPELYRFDVKKSYVEGGKCPLYVCSCVSDETTTPTAFIFYGGRSGSSKLTDEEKRKFNEELKDHCSSLTNPILSLRKCELKELKFDLIDQINVDSGTSSVFARSVSNLKYDDIKYLINFFDFKLENGNNIPGIDKTVSSTELSILTKFLDYRYLMFNGIKNKSDIPVLINEILEDQNHKFGDERDKIYGELVKAVKSYQTFHDSDISLIYSQSQGMNCTSLFGDPSDKTSFAYYLNLILSVIQWAGPVLVVILVTFDYFKALVEKNPDVLKKTNTRTMIRIILVFILFYVPFFVKFILTTFGIQEYCNLS